MRDMKDNVPTLFFGNDGTNMANCIGLRDYFAGQVIAGLAANSSDRVLDMVEEAIRRGDDNKAFLARVAYRTADAMLKEREKE